MSVYFQRRPAVLLAVALAAVPAGCRVAPDVEPFVETTATLNVVVSSVGRDLGSTLEGSQREQFVDAWSSRAEAMQAIADYASGLAQVIEAGKDGAKSAKAVLDGANELLGALDIAFPGTGAAGELVTSAVKEGYRLFAEHRAASKVAKAIEDTAPVVDEVAGALAKDMVTLEKMVADLHNGAMVDLAGKCAEIDGGGLRLLKSLRDQGGEMRTKAARITDSGARARLIDESKQIDELIELEMQAPWYQEFAAERTAMIEAFESRRSVIRAAAAATIAWSRAHADLARASRTRKAPDYSVLIAITQDLLAAYQEARKP